MFRTRRQPYARANHARAHRTFYLMQEARRPFPPKPYENTIVTAVASNHCP